MKMTVLTLFPEIMEGFVRSSIFSRAVAKGLVECEFVNFRDFTQDKYRKADDVPFGGGAGMVLKPEPLFGALESVGAASKRVVFPTPSGKPFDQKYAEELSRESELIFIAGHYEGVDQRVIDRFVTDEISIGDYVLSSGEVACLAVMDAVHRLIGGVLAADSLDEESFSNGLLEYPQYTRPRECGKRMVPEVLLSGNHAEIAKWRRFKSLEKTYANRPDLLEKGDVFLTASDRRMLDEIKRNF